MKINEHMVASIVKLLRDTDMTLAQIAKRFGVSDRSIGSINRKYSIRANSKYEFRRKL